MANGILGDLPPPETWDRDRQERAEAEAMRVLERMYAAFMEQGAWRMFCTIEQPNTRH